MRVVGVRESALIIQPPFLSLLHLKIEIPRESSEDISHSLVRSVQLYLLIFLKPRWKYHCLYEYFRLFNTF